MALCTIVPTNICIPNLQRNMEYASAISSMMYTMHCTRPVISFLVGKLSRSTSNPNVDHWKEIARVLGHLKKTISLGLFYS